MKIEQFTSKDQRTIKVETGYIDKHDPPLPDTADAVTTLNMDAEALMRQPLVTNAFLWQTSSATGTDLVSYQIPAVFKDLKAYHRRILELYAFVKFKLRIQVRVNTTKFHSGKLIVWWDPMDLSSTTTMRAPVPHRAVNVYRASGMPNVIIDCGDSNPGIIEIPWEHFESFINLMEPGVVSDQFGTIHVMVLNPLQATSNVSQSVGVNVMLSASEVVLRMPVRPHTLNVVTVESHMDKISGALSKGKQVASSALGAFANLKTGNFSGAANSASSGLKSLGSLLKDFNLDKPTDPLNKTKNCLTTSSPLAHMEGVDQSVRLAASPDSGYLLNDFSNANSQEMLISNIIQTKMLFDIVDWSANAEQGTVLATYPVRPSVTGSNLIPNLTVGTYTVQQESPTYLSYVEKMFRYWSGSIVFRFDFAASQFHSGRLQFSFEPAINPAPLETSTTIQDYSQLPNVIFDLRESKSITIHIPWNSHLKRLLTYQSQAGKAYVEDISQCLGLLRVTVLDPLVVPDNVAQSIPYNAYVAAGDDFEFDVPVLRQQESQFAFDVSAPTVVVTPHMDDDVKTRSEDNYLGYSLAKGNRRKVKHDAFNERIIDVRQLARRYTLLNVEAIPLVSKVDLSTQPPLYAGVTAINPHPLPAITASDTAFANYQDMSSQFVAFVSQLYAFWSGSLRYKCMPLTSRNVKLSYLVSYVTSPGDYLSSNNTLTGAPSIVQFNSQDLGVEFETPYYSIYNHLLTSFDSNINEYTGLRDPYSLPSVQITRLAAGNDLDPIPGQTNTLGLYESIFYAGGDDLMFRYLIAPPNIYRPAVVPTRE